MLKRSLAVSALALALAGCLASTGNKTSDSGVASGAAAAPTAGEYKAPSGDVNVDAIKPAHLNTGTVLIVPTAYVKLPVAGKVGVTQQGSALSTLGKKGGANTVKASAEFKVTGLDKAFAQQIAIEVYNDFVAQLRAAGYTVLTYADIKDRDVVKNAGRAKPDSTWGMPTESVFGGNSTAIIAAPSDEQAFETGFNGGIFNQFISLGKTKLTDGIIIIPQYTITAPQVWGEKNHGYSTISAAVKAAPAMVMAHANATWLTNKPKVEVMSGIPGVHLKGTPGLSDKVGELKMVQDTTPGAANAISKGLSILSGAGSINSKSAKYEMAIDRDTYSKAAIDGMKKFNAEVGKIAKEQKPAS